MLHRSFDGVNDEECLISLALNDSYAAVIFGADYAKAIEVSQGVLNDFPDSPHTFLIASHTYMLGRCHVFLTRYDVADEYLHRAGDMVETISPVTHDVLRPQGGYTALSAMNTYHAHRDDAVCISYLERALAILEETDFSNRKGICLIGIGNIRKGKANIRRRWNITCRRCRYSKR
jgi:tetratricopeptide (TPR) repeat protein